MSYDSQVQVPHEYYAKSKREYSDWRWAFFRELFQNSYDSGATEFRFQIRTEENGDIMISCADNGCGMNEDVLRNVLFKLGGSLKADGSVGGFGYAKVLLFFAHQSFVVCTKDLLVQGSGGSYSIRKSPTYINGTSVCVRMKNEGWTQQMFADKMRSYFSYCALQRDVLVTLNDEVVPTRFTEFEFATQTALGDFSFKEIENGTSKVVVAVRGLPMFVHHVWSTASVGFVGLLEVAGDSLDVLTANRDSLKGEHAEKLNKIVQQMVENRHQFKGGTTLDITLNYSDPVALERATLGMSKEEAVVFAQRMQELHDELRYMRNNRFPNNFQLRLQSLVGRGNKENESGVISVSEVLTALKKTYIRKMAMVWKATVYFVLATEYGKKIGVKYFRDDGTEVTENIQAEDFQKGAFYVHGTRITTGFIFSKGTEGLNVIPKDGSDIMIMCNPTCFDAKFKVGDLLDLAIHESSHLCVSGHGEVFVDVDMKFRRSFRRLMNEAELKELVKQIIAQHTTQIEQE
jgi:hypothetical protein